MKDKYIEERFPRYFPHGTHADGRVDVDTVDGVVASMSLADSARVIADRHALLDALIEMARAFESADPDGFVRHWYGKPT